MKDYEIKVGDKRLFMTAAFYWVGRIAKVTPTEFWLDQCSFIDDLGLLSACQTGKVNNYERVPDGTEVKRGAYITSLPWTAELPQ